MPHYPYALGDGAEEPQEQYEVADMKRHIVKEFTGLDFERIGQLNYLEFLKHYRDAFIWHLRRFEKGREYLNNAWRLEDPEIDRKALREYIERHGQ